MESFVCETQNNSLERTSALWRSGVRGATIFILSLYATTAWGVGNDMSGTCINDVGRGAMLWGTSSEVTTYSEPYLPYRTPEIYRIPMTSEEASRAPETANDYQGTVGNAMERLTESGTIFGADGKLYEYTYTRGVEPRRIIETRRVQNKYGVWNEEKIEHIEWSPVLIRVLRPAGTNAKIETQAAALRNALATPAPCDQVGAAEPRTFADQTDSNAASQSSNSSTTQTPPVEGTSPVLASRREEASVRVSTPAATVGPKKSLPVLTLPEEVRRNAQKEAAQKESSKTDRRSAQSQRTNPRQNLTAQKSR